MFVRSNHIGYAQILQMVVAKVLSGEYVAGGRVPSVREMAVELEVNPLTITRAYDRLQLQGVLTVKRGMGYFVTEEAHGILVGEERKRFWEETLPQLRETLAVLGISPEELVEHLQSKDAHPK